MPGLILFSTEYLVIDVSWMEILVWYKISCLRLTTGGHLWDFWEQSLRATEVLQYYHNLVFDEFQFKILIYNLHCYCLFGFFYVAAPSLELALIPKLGAANLKKKNKSKQ